MLTFQEEKPRWTFLIQERSIRRKQQQHEHEQITTSDKQQYGNLKISCIHYKLINTNFTHMAV